jgi:predicted CopG family antitoxin
MAHKTLTISEEAYEALAKLKSQNESFTQVILRLSKEKESGKLSEYLKSIKPDEELARNVEAASARLRATRFRKVKL